MTFNKELYWKRRKEGMRGQDSPLLAVMVDFSKELREDGTPKYSNDFNSKSRKLRRQKIKDNRFKKKGFTRVIKMDGDKAFNIPTRIGSKVHQQAINNVQKFKKAQSRGE